jgi:hypothetical protein
MSARELIGLLAPHRGIVLAVLLAPLAAAVLLPLLHGAGAACNDPWRLAYSAVVHATCVPGVLATILTAYVLLFTQESLLDVDLVVHALPIVVMAVTLGLVRRQVDFAHLPGFDRLSGLLLVLALTFGIVFALSRTRIWILFGGSFTQFLAVCAALYGLLTWGVRRAFPRPGEPQVPPPGPDLR